MGTPPILSGRKLWMRRFDMNDVSYEKSSGNVFADLGFSPAATADLSVKWTCFGKVESSLL
jgi:hypothetical protein